MKYTALVYYAGNDNFFAFGQGGSKIEWILNTYPAQNVLLKSRESEL